MNCTCASRSTTLEKFCRIFQDCSGKNKMAATSGGAGDGRKRQNSGRKRTIFDVKQYKKDWFKRHKRVFLEYKIFKSWLGVLLETGLMKVPATNNQLVITSGFPTVNFRK